MPITLIILFATSVFAAVSGESRFASLSQNGGMQGNPAALSAYESPGTILGYEEVGGKNNFLFGFWGNRYGASFDWTTKNGYDKSEWSIVDNEFNTNRSFFFGNRFSATRTSQNDGTAASWSPGFIFRPFSFVSFGFWSEYALQYGFYQNRVQNAGLSIRPYDGITASWNVGVRSYEQLKHFRSQTEQNLLLELEAFDLTLGLEFPLVEPDNNGEFRISLSAALGSRINASFGFAANDLNSNMDFKRINFIRHSALNQESLSRAGLVRVPLGSISEKSSSWSLFGAMQSDLETLRNTFDMLEKSDARAVVFDFSNYSGGFSISQEIRRGIYSLKARGKKIAAYTNDYRPSVIFAASAADKIILQPSA
ncbi:MAG: hypothetical protein LBB36_05035, partial [Fibromonadaceae bacterium]|nr:hypothetical protein [Fibromonadaceae bacterium]